MSESRTMIVPRGSGDINVKYRPCKFSELYGNDIVKSMLSNFIKHHKLPHAMLFTGQSGCGKTTAARIVAMALNCEAPGVDPCCECAYCKAALNMNSFALIELDGARTGNVETVRGTLDSLPSAVMSGEEYKIVIFDEAHKLSDKAESALLKFLEDTPNHVYIILCTNEPQKLEEVTRNRCKLIQFGRLKDNELLELLEVVSEYEGFDYKSNKEILRYIVEESGGVPRQALTYLHQIGCEGSWTKEAASIIISSGIGLDETEIMDFSRAVLKTPNFLKSVALYKTIKRIPLETIRISMCGFFVGCLKNARSGAEAMKFSRVIDLLQESYFNNPKPEHKFINTLYKITGILKGPN